MIHSISHQFTKVVLLSAIANSEVIVILILYYSLIIKRKDIGATHYESVGQ